MKSILYTALVLITSLQYLGCGGGDEEGFDAAKFFALNNGPVMINNNIELSQNVDPNTTIVVGGLDNAVSANSNVTIANLDSSEQRTLKANNKGGFIAAITGSPLDQIQIQSGGSRIIIDSQFFIDVPLDTRIKLMGGAVNRNLAQLGSVPTSLEIFNNRAYVLNGFSDNIQVFDITQHPPEQTATIALPLGSDPVGIAFLDNSRAYVTNLISQTVAIINLSTNTCETIISQQGGSFEPCDEVIVVDEGSFANPAGIAITNDKVYVANQNIDESFAPLGNGFITVIDSDTNEIIEIIDATGEGTSGTGTGIKVINDKIYVVNSGNVLFDFETLLFTCDTSSPLSIDIIDPDMNIIEDSIDFPLSGINPFVCSPESITPAPDGESAYIGSQLAGVIFEIDLNTNTLTRGASNPIVITSTDDLDSTSDIEFNSHGYGFISIFNSDRIYAFDPQTNEVTPFPFVGEFPVGLRGDDPASELFEGVQDLAVLDMEGKPDLFFITSIIQGSESLCSVNTSLFTP